MKYAKNNLDDIIKKVISETIAYHGSNSDFNNFDLAYVNTGMKLQDYGYGIYVSLSERYINDYGKIKYIVEIPSNDELYLHNDKIENRDFIAKLKNELFNYLINNDEEEIWKGTENFLLKDLNSNIAPTTGLKLYNAVSYYLRDDKLTSNFFYYKLNKIGLKYIDNNIVNAVIFNPNEIKIIQKNNSYLK